MAWRPGLIGVVAVWLCVSFGLSLGMGFGLSPGTASAAERSIAGASVSFPGSEAALHLAQDEPGVPDGWIQRASADQDQRVYSFGEMKLAFWVRWLIAVAPEAVMERSGDRLVAGIREMAKGGVTIAEPEWVVVNGHPGWRLRMTKADMSQIIRSPSGAPALLFSHRYIDMVVLWSGERMVVAATSGDEKLKGEAFLHSLRTMTTVVPGDADAQWDFLCRFGGAVIGVVPLLLIASVVAAMMAIRRRGRSWHRNSKGIEGSRPQAT